MSPIRRFGTTLLAAAALGLPFTPAAVAAPTHHGCASSAPFTSGSEGYDTFRIPAVVRAADGSLVAFAEGRRDGAGDSGAIQTVSKTSRDGGCTWGSLTVVDANGDNTAGNPTPVVARDGELVLLTVHNGPVSEAQIMSGTASEQDTRRVFVLRSKDNGHTWSPARDITTETKLPTWRWYATGPGHATLLRHGPHAGRIVVPANHSSAPPAGSTDVGTEAKYYGGHDLYSDDNGRTWHIGFTDDRTDGVIAANETSMTELPTGALYFTSRNQGSAADHRVDGYSLDGGKTLSKPYQVQPGISGTKVEGSVLQTTIPWLLLYSGPADPATRAVMQLRLSLDGGHTWRPGRTLTDNPAGYSDLVQADPATVGLLYETGTAGPYESVVFQRIPLTDVR
ncbi:sialidase family protein [Amycolatopsis rhabdoformis]|uniref:exo-alpha-sialidase n=1 Tax=Amycolatopsis rhabdoformis TaxID=1448059 RepID=A0ABZ1HX15_9PSEU|nr:sialidase family protein [Amycolatopsis rhabdoformis]WSE25928.1 sialidase family protein [Amycolatopsis rhabdoformis]